MWLVPVIPLSKRLRQNCNFKVRPEMEELRRKKRPESALPPSCTDHQLVKSWCWNIANRQAALAMLSIHADTQAQLCNTARGCHTVRKPNLSNPINIATSSTQTGETCPSRSRGSGTPQVQLSRAPLQP